MFESLSISLRLSLVAGGCYSINVSFTSLFFEDVSNSADMNGFTLSDTKDIA